MAENDNEWLWEVEDEPASGGLSIEQAASDAAKTALASEAVVTVLGLHLARRTDDALKELEKAAGKREHLDEVYAVLGQIQFERGKYKEAADAFGKLMDEEPRHRTGYYNLGVSLYRAGDPAAAAPAFEKAVNVSPDRTEARLGWAMALVCLGEFARAADQFTSYIAAGGSNPAALLGKAVSLHKTGKPAEAVEAYRRVLVKNPNSIDALSNLVAIGLEGGEQKLVREFAERLAKLKPQSRHALEGLAALALGDGKFDVAARVLNELTKFAGDAWQVWYNLGIACQKLNRRDDAVKALAQAAKLNEKSAEPHAALGYSLELKGDAEGARKAYEKALQLAPGHETSLWNMALLAEAAGIARRRPSCSLKPSASARTGPMRGSASATSSSTRASTTEASRRSNNAYGCGRLGPKHGGTSAARCSGQDGSRRR